MEFDDHCYSTKIQKLIKNFQSLNRLRISKNERYHANLFDEIGEEPDPDHIYDSINADTLNQNVKFLYYDAIIIEINEL